MRPESALCRISNRRRGWEPLFALALRLVSEVEKIPESKGSLTTEVQHAQGKTSGVRRGGRAEPARDKSTRGVSKALTAPPHSRFRLKFLSGSRTLHDLMAKRTPSHCTARSRSYKRKNPTEDNLVAPQGDGPQLFADTPLMFKSSTCFRSGCSFFAFDCKFFTTTFRRISWTTTWLSLMRS